MKPADLALVQSMFNVVAPTAAAEMKSRVLGLLRELKNHRAWDGVTIDEAVERIEALPLSKETP